MKEICTPENIQREAARRFKAIEDTRKASAEEAKRSREHCLRALLADINRAGVEAGLQAMLAGQDTWVFEYSLSKSLVITRRFESPRTQEVRDQEYWFIPQQVPLDRYGIEIGLGPELLADAKACLKESGFDVSERTADTTGDTVWVFTQLPSTQSAKFDIFKPSTWFAWLKSQEKPA